MRTLCAFTDANKTILEGKGAFGRKLKNLKIINGISDSQLGDGFSPGSSVSDAALFGHTCPYHPDSETGEGFFDPS